MKNMVERIVKIPRLFGFVSLAVIVMVAVGIYSVYRVKTVTVIHPVRGPAVLAVYATGTVEPEIMLPVAPRISSRLIELFVSEGQRVKKGMILARLEDTDIRKDLTDAEAKASFAQKEYERQATLVKKGTISRQVFDQTKTALQSAQAVVEKIKATLSYMTLLAPNDGIVIRRDGEIGEFMTAGQAVFWLAENSMRVTAQVDEEDITLVKPGQKVLIRADAFSGEVFDGKVQSITPKGDPVARSYRARISLPLDTKLMIGMTAEANIIIRDDANALLIPVSAVQNKTVWVVRDGLLKQQSVKTGAQNTHEVEILSGLSENDFVLKEQRPGLKQDMQINTRLNDWKVLP